MIADSTFASDEEHEPKIIIANHHVRLFSDSLQAVCDSLSYAQSDSVFRLYRNPILWSKTQQIRSSERPSLRSYILCFQQTNRIFFYKTITSTALLISKIPLFDIFRRACRSKDNGRIIICSPTIKNRFLSKVRDAMR